MLTSGAALYAAGAAACLSLPGPGWIAGLLFCAWCARGAHALLQRQLEDRRVAAVALDSEGSLELVGDGGSRVPARRLAGTLVLERAIWLRYRDREGRTGAQLFLGDPRIDADFRRAGVLLRLPASGQKN